MIIKDREIVQVDTGEVEKLFQWLNRVVNMKLIQAGRDLNKGVNWSDIAFDISEYVKEVSNIVEHKISAKQYTREELDNILNSGTEELNKVINSGMDFIFYPVEDEVITPPPPKPRKEITGKDKEEKKDFPIGSLAEFIRDRSEPIGTAGRAWATLSEKWTKFFKECDYKYVACPNSDYWWVIADLVTTKRGKNLYVLMTNRDEKEKLWCLAAPTDIEIQK